MVMRTMTAKAVMRERPAMRVEMMPLMVRAKPRVRRPRARTERRVIFMYFLSVMDGSTKRLWMSWE